MTTGRINQVIYFSIDTFHFTVISTILLCNKHKLWRHTLLYFALLYFDSTNKRSYNKLCSEEQVITAYFTFALLTKHTLEIFHVQHLTNV